MRIGQGFDLHRLIEGRKLLLGGVEIPSSKGEDAHSDGDVLLHAVIDALLGAEALGDIGKLFPPSDPKYKDAKSSALLLEAKKLTRCKLVNLDCTIILQEPKIGKYADAIRENLASLLDAEVKNISVKAKTAEGLGAIGEGAAVAASVIVLVE